MGKSSLFGWLALSGAMLCGVIFTGFVSQTGLLIEPMTSDLGISRTMFSTLLSITPLTNMVISLFFARFAEKLGLKAMALLGSAAAILYCTLMAMSGAVSPSLRCVVIGLSSALQAVNISWATVMTASLLINNWFARNNGTLLSMYAACSGIGSSVAATIVSRWILEYGWAFSLLLRAGMCMATFLFLLFFLRVTPGEHDCMVWADVQKEEKLSISTDESHTGLTFDEVRNTLPFLCCLFTVFGLGCFISPPIQMLSAYAIDSGYAQAAGQILSMVFLSNIIITVPLGGLIERYGNRVVLTIMLALTAGALGVLSAGNMTLPQFYLGAVLLGFGYATLQVPLPLLVRELYGDKDFTRIQSFFFSALVGGICAGSIAFNAVFDLLGSYRMAYLTYGVITALLIGTLFVATSRSGVYKRGVL